MCFTLTSSKNRISGSFKPTFDNLFLERVMQHIMKKAQVLDLVFWNTCVDGNDKKVMLMIYFQISGCSRNKSCRYN